MSFSKLDKITKFELNIAHTYGVEKSKFGGFTISVELDKDPETYQKIFQLFVDNRANNIIYGTIFYLKTKMLSTKNREELLNKGGQDILIHFETKGVYTRDEKRHLIFEVTKLCKLEIEQEEE